MPSFNGNILVTDDDPDLRRVLRRTLDALGFEVVRVFEWGAGASRRWRSRRFDAVLLDVNMPGMGGIEACREIRRKAPRLQILMLTVRDREADKIEALDAGADDYITKPFSIPELAARLRSAVRRSATAATRCGDARSRSARSNWIPAGGSCAKQALCFAPDTQGIRPAALPDEPSGSARRPLRSSCGPYGAKNTARNWNTCARSCISCGRKLEDDPSSPEYLLTELHFGYRFREPSEVLA